MALGAHQEQQQATKQGIALRMLYNSATTLALSQAAYEAHLEQCIEDNIFLQANEVPRASDKQPAGEGLYEESLAYRPRLSEVLLDQWRLMDTSALWDAAAQLVVSNLSPQGFHVLPLRKLATNEMSLGCLQRVAQLVSSLEPLGCAVEDWVESVWVQSLYQPLYAGWSNIGLTKFRDALHYWQTDQWPLAAELLDVSVVGGEAELRSYLARFTPYPGLAYDVAEIAYAQSDLRLEQHSDGNLEVVLVSHLGVERLSDEVYSAMQQQLNQPSELAWLRQKWYQAGQVLAMHHYRAMQLLRVANHLVGVQSNYLNKSSLHLEPLQLADVAKALQMSVSTVSRIMKDKVLQTQTRSLMLKELLSLAQEHGGKRYSREAVKQKIKFLLYQHNKTKISDAKISRLLALEEIYLARRTITKYRHEMNL
jgi:RNA polymerase sigma-54 factor